MLARRRPARPASARPARARGGPRRSARRRRARSNVSSRSSREPRSPLDVPEALQDELEVRRLDASPAPPRRPPRPAGEPGRSGPRRPRRAPRRRARARSSTASPLRRARCSARAARGSPRAPASRSRWSSRSEFANRPGMRSLNTSSCASASSRMPSRTLTRSPGRVTSSASRSANAAGPSLVAVVEEELLELVEDQAELAAERGAPGREPVGASAGASPGPAPSTSATAARAASSMPAAGPGPRAEARDRGELAVSRDSPQRADDAGPEQRALADAARPVEHREPRREDVRRDDLASRARGRRRAARRRRESSNGASPLYGRLDGASGRPRWLIATAAPARLRAAAVRQPLDVLVERRVDELDAAPPPELPLERARRRAGRPTSGSAGCSSGHSRCRKTRRLQSTQPVAEEEEVAAPQPRRERHREDAADAGLREVGDVVVLADDEALRRRAPASRSTSPWILRITVRRRASTSAYAFGSVDHARAARRRDGGGTCPRSRPERDVRDDVELPRRRRRTRCSSARS